MVSITKKKICTAVLVVPPIIFLIAIGPKVILTLMILLAIFFGLREFYHLALPQSNSLERWIGMCLGLFLPILISCIEMEIFLPFLVLILLSLCIIFMVTSHNLSSTISNLGIMLFGILYIGFLLSHISLIRNLNNGRIWVLFLIATVWAGDICAFLSGSIFGRHKLYPKISPKKTYEGLAGAIAGSISVSIIFAFIFIPKLNKGISIFLAIGLAVLGQLGDFTESMLKRSAQVKDSGALIPGHGGMLDRLDSFLFSAPFLHYSLIHLFKDTI